MNTGKFNKRIYHSLKEIIRDAAAIMKQRKDIKALMQDNLISESLRERIMLAVTEVNGCRYCQYAHAKMALKAGLSQDEIDRLAEGAFHNSPQKDVPALLFAQHWAEANGSPDKEVRQKVIDTYGLHITEGMELAMRMIRMGNLLGNTFDYLLFKFFPRLYTKHQLTS